MDEVRSHTKLPITKPANSSSLRRAPTNPSTVTPTVPFAQKQDTSARTKTAAAPWWVQRDAAPGLELIDMSGTEAGSSRSGGAAGIPTVHRRPGHGHELVTVRPSGGPMMLAGMRVRTPTCEHGQLDGSHKP